MIAQPTLTNWLSILFLGLVWGGTFMVVAIALEGYGPLTVSAARAVLGAVALLGLALVLRRPLPAWSARLIIYIVAIGMLSTAVPFALLSWGILYVPSAFAGISMAALPLIVLPLAHFFSDEPLSGRALTGVLTGFIGALVLIGPGVLRLGTGLEPLAQLACIAASASYAVSNVLTRRCPPIDPTMMSALLLVTGAVALLPAALWIEGPPAFAVGRSTPAIVLLGLVPTALAVLLRIHTIRTAGSVFMTLVNYQVPVWSMVFGAWVLSETLPLRFFAALALILAGLMISQWPALRRLLR